MKRLINEHKKISVGVMSLLVFLLIIGVAYGRYIYNIVDNYILETKGFYFNSSVLSINTREYKINNWDGVNNYTLTVDLNSKKNSLVSTDSDIDYTISVTCPTDVTCVASKNNGTIAKESKSDSYTITVSTTKKYSAGETLSVYTEAHSTSPYEKTLSGRYIIGVETSNFTYNIEDTANEPYFILNMTNSIPYYEVATAFNSYKVGDKVSLDKYNALTDAQKANCFSAIITVSFDPNLVYLDMTNINYLNRRSNSQTTTSIDGFNYVNKFSFNIDAASSSKILFYKADKSENYTYPIVNSSSIINVATKLAN